MELKIKRHYSIDTFNQFSLLLKYDSVASAFSFSFYFDPNNPQHRLLFQPGHYHQCDIVHNGELLVRGWIISQGMGESSEKVLSSINGYSLPGVLEDCQIPLDVYPLQHDGKTLKEIATTLISKFPFKVQIDASVSTKMESVYDVTAANENQTIKEYLTSLATQKDVVISHTPSGDLLFTKAKTKQNPFFHFNNNMPNVEMSMKFNGQAMHSHIWVQKQADVDGGNAGEELIRNPFVPYVYRPTVITQSSGTDIDTKEAAKQALSAELKNIVLTIKTSMWEIDGAILKPNTVVAVTNPELYIYKKVNWFVESIQFDGDETETVATLTCVLPEVYNNEYPDYFFKVNEEKTHG